MTPIDLIISTVQAGDTLLQSAVCCGTAMAEVMTDFVLLEAAEDGKILKDITDDVTEGSNAMLRTLCLKSLYLIAPIPNAVVEPFFSHQKILSSLPEDTVLSSKQSGERSSSNTAPTFSLGISWMPLSRGRL